MGKKTITRKRIRLDRTAYDLKNTFFSITICCSDKIPYLDNLNLSESILKTIANGMLNRHTRFLAFCLMSDHVHFLVQIQDSNLVDEVARWKSFTTRLFWENGGTGSLWQRSFYDHGVRNEKDLVLSASYIIENPLRAGRADSIPFTWSYFSTKR